MVVNRPYRLAAGPVVPGKIQLVPVLSATQLGNDMFHSITGILGNHCHAAAIDPDGNLLVKPSYYLSSGH